jgi:Putative auto-transporter adhesin, head GIN domain
MIKVIIMLTKFIIATTIALLLNSCNIKADFGTGEKGNGKLTTEVRNIKEDFSSVDVGAGIEVVLEQSKDKFVSVEAESNLQKLIDTKVENGVLIIEPNESINATKTIKVTIRMPKIEGLEASIGSAIKGIGAFKGDSISIDASSAAAVNVNLKYDNITLDASSGSSINAKGIALKLESSASSGSEIDANELLVNEVDADVSSGGNIQVHPIVKLNGNASSGGNITYNIEPKSITKDESSGGNVGKE